MKKRYLKMPEDVLALKDTDTKIYEKHATWYYKFVKGVLCRFNAYNGVTYFNCKLDMEEDIYILEEEPMQEATADDIGKLCLFWNADEIHYIGILKSIDKKSIKRFYLVNFGYFENCHKLSPSEVAELTGYKVSFADQSDAKVEEVKWTGKN